MERREGAPAGAGAGEDPAVDVTVELDVPAPAEAACADGAPAQAAADAADAELRARVRSLEAQLELAQEKGRETFAKLREEHEARLRGAADLENARKRAQREREEIQRFGSERLLKDLLPVVDNLDRALAAAPAGDPLAKGVGLVRKGLEEALARHGVEAFSAVGKPFDPRLHEALAQLEVPGAEPGSVVAEHGRGFLLHGRLLRPAMVAVAPARAASAAPSPPAGDPPGTPPAGEPARSPPPPVDEPPRPAPSVDEPGRAPPPAGDPPANPNSGEA